MMAAEDFLAAALSTDGYICIHCMKGTGKNKHPFNTFFAPGDYASAVAFAMKQRDDGWDVYFATSTYKEKGDKSASKVLAVRMLKLDLDVGPGKNETFDDALNSLRIECKELELPRPTLVASGYGLHAYWLYTVPMDAGRGKLCAEEFKEVIGTTKLKTDPTVTGDIARIMRLPETKNFKNPDAPQEVRVLMHGGHHDTDELEAKVHALYKERCGSKKKEPQLPQHLADLPIPEHLRGLPMDEATKNLLGHKPKKFGIIVAKALTGEGCNQIKYAWENRQTLEEPRWYATMSIAHYCEDGDEACHQWSKDYSKDNNEYSWEETEKKRRGMVGPWRCDKFKSSWPAECEGCSLKISSPIMTGAYVKMAPEEEKVLGKNASVDDAETTYTIPQYPRPFFRQDGGGVCRLMREGSSGEREEDRTADGVRVLTDIDVYMVDRLIDETGAFLVQFRVHHRRDGVFDFVMNGSQLNQLDQLKLEFGKRGIYLASKDWEIMREYVAKWFDVLKMHKDATKLKKQFGWTDDFKSFVIGNREIFPNVPEAKFSATAPSLENIAKHFTKEGSLEEWRKAFDTYAQPGMEASAFCALIGFASPLMALTEHRGVCVNAFNVESGTGKSTTLIAATSIWGNPNPEGMLMNYKDTMNSRVIRMGVYQHMPICIDEVTMMSEEDMRDTLMFSTQGRGKDRAKSSTNEIRDNDSTWQAPTLMSSNKSQYDTLQAMHVGRDGELMRLLEIEVPVRTDITAEQTAAWFSPLKKNYGHAGDIYARYLLENPEEIRALMAEYGSIISRRFSKHQRERFWVAICTCVVVGNIAARNAGLTSIDPERTLESCGEFMEKCRSRLRFMGSSEKPLEEGKGTSEIDTDNEILNLFSEFMSWNSPNTLHASLVTLTDGGKQVEKWTTHNEGKVQKLWVRYEHTDENETHDEVFATSDSLNEFFKTRGATRSTVMDIWKRAGFYVGTVTKRMGAGATSLHNAPMKVHHFKVPKPKE